MEKLEMIPSSKHEEAVQPALEVHHCGSQAPGLKHNGIGAWESAVDALSAYASWLRTDFKRQLSDMVGALNEISREEVRKFDEKLSLDCSVHQLQPESGAECGKHLGLLVAPIKSKERALAKIKGDYETAWAASFELTSGRDKEGYVCDFLRATIYAADPFALALAFHSLQERFKIVRVKNKFADQKLQDEERQWAPQRGLSWFVNHTGFRV
ncbi:unnamed protein product [Symbiodinium natans]|uniref:Uncharacterized protein n=1 Tax=Symbiodinium natans TaxID=878477 RepID=A0A812NZY3_9DINO|nr:unnamed protein product [Symbiodinium natans]